MNSKYEGIWKLLYQYDFHIDTILSTDLYCVICKRILIDGRQAPCACKFCYKCICEYLINGEKVCPGSNEECKEEILQLDTNVVVDYSTIRKIAKLIVKCPLEMCCYEDELFNMETHLRVCNAKPASCPYIPIGCNEVNIDKYNMNAHLDICNYDHIKLMIDTIENLKNQMRVNEIEYENKIKFLSSENVKLKEEYLKTQTIVTQFQQLINQSNSEFCAKLNQLTQNQKKLDELCNQSKENQIKITSDMEIINTTSKELKENMENKINKLKNPSSENDEISYVQIRKLENMIEKVRRKIGEIIWKIDICEGINLENESGALLYSDCFYSHPNGYKLQLVLRPGGCWDSSGFGVSVYTRMLQGNNDSRLQWPITFDIIVGIINQDNDEYHKSDTRTIEFSTSPFDPSSTFKFRHSDFNESVLKNNCLIIECSVAIVSIG